MIVTGKIKCLPLTWLLVLMHGFPSTLQHVRRGVEDSTNTPIQPSSAIGRVSSPTEDESLHEINNTVGKWCLRLITETSETNFENRQKFEPYTFSLKPGNQCDVFDPTGQNETHVDLLYISVSFVSKSENLLCVEFIRGYDQYLENATIIGETFTKLIKPGEREVISGLKRHCTSEYVVEVKCKTGNTSRKTIHVNKWFPIKLVSIYPDEIHWSYPEEGLPCIKEFQIVLNGPSKHQRNKSFKRVPTHEETSGFFGSKLHDPSDICFPKNITITVVFTNDIEGIPITVYSDFNLSFSNPVDVWTNQSCVVIHWKIPVLFRKCVKEVRVFNGSRTTAIKPPDDRVTFEKLDACRLYTFTIEVIDLYGISRSQVVANVTNWNVVEDKVVDLHLIKTETKRPRIQWNPPNGMAYCIEEYFIEELFYDLESGQVSNISSTVRVNAKFLSNQIITCQLIKHICLLTSVKVTPISSNGSRWNTATLNVSSRDSVQNLHVYPLSPSSVNITWDPPLNSFGCIANYSIYKKKFPNETLYSNSTHLMIDTLTPCLNYNFVVVPFNRYGLNHSLAIAHVSMPEQRVQQFKYIGDTIQWSLPTKGISCIKGFQVVEITAHNQELINSVTIPSKFEPITYRFRKPSYYDCKLFKNIFIVPILPEGKLGYRYVLEPFLVQDVVVNATVKLQIYISWKKSKFFPECVHSYRISYDDRNFTSYENFVTISNLNSCIEYNFKIAAVDHYGKDLASVIFNATVKEEKPSEVQDLELIEGDPRSLMVKWKPPANGKYCVESYWYEIWATKESNLVLQASDSTTALKVTIAEVFACTKYNVKVIPDSKGENDGNNAFAEVTTKERVIFWYHIDPIQIKIQKAQELELQTALTKDTNNFCRLQSVRFTCTTNYVPTGEDPKVITGEANIIDPKATFSAVVTPLQPYTEYNCTAAILNIAGWSDESALVHFMTGEDFPEQPENLQLTEGVRMIELKWKAPKVKNGIISRYQVHIRSERVRYPTPSHCPQPNPYNFTFELPEDDENARLKNWNNDELNQRISFLNPYTDYVVQVAAATQAGLGPYTKMVSILTLPEQSDPVFEFLVCNVTLPVIDKPYKSVVHISWKIPCHLYGRLRNFTGQFNGYQGIHNHTFDWTRTIDPSEEILETYSLTEDRLKPDFQYNVSIMVFVEDVANHSTVKFLSFQSPAELPNIIHEVNWGTVNAMDAPDPTRTARIRLSANRFQSNVGRITNIALLVSERYCQPDPVPKRNLLNKWSDVPSWKDATQMPCISQYQTTPKQWNPVENRKLGGSRNLETEYIIGEDQCDNVQGYCNGPLKPGTAYALIVRVFTNSGYSDTATKFFQTEPRTYLTVILTSICVCLLLSLSVGLTLLWRTQKLIVLASAVHSPNVEPVDIPLKSFVEINEELLPIDREKLDNEYQAINLFSMQLINSEKVTFFVAKNNEMKNRYVGIFPYDTNRVLLDVGDIVVEEDEESNDYINASFIDGYKYQREYIATQGPKKETCFDFWRMILQYKVESIVMLTQTVENDRIKCYQYFPQFNQTLHFREVSVKCTLEVNLGFYQKRVFVVTRSNMSRVVFHYHFLVWPDHGCPSSASDLIKFINIIRSERKNHTIPVVVHCSAGVGRTGTLIALDIILQQLQAEQEINIYDTVKQLRSQRVRMVQTSEQYGFLYHACLEFTARNNWKNSKTSTEEFSSSMRSSLDSSSSVVPKNGSRPMINIKLSQYI